MSKSRISRRQTLKLAAGATALAAGGLTASMRALAAERLQLINLGFSLGIHCPPIKGLVDELPGMGVALDIQRFQKIRDNVQAVIGGAGDIGIAGPINLLRSIQAGNDLRIFGNNYLHTTLVVVVNSDVIRSWKDFEKDDVTVGINSQGDITQVLIIGGLTQNDIKHTNVNWADIGGSGSRLRALIANRIQATVIHFDQVPLVQKEGNYKEFLIPAKYYHPWVNEVVYARADWLDRPENRDMAVKVMKAIMIGSRKANASFDYYKASFLEHATIKGKSEMPDEAMRSYYNTLAHEMGVWPADNEFHVSNFEKLTPYYLTANAIAADKPLDLPRVIDTSIVAQGLKELG